MLIIYRWNLLCTRASAFQLRPAVKFCSAADNMKFCSDSAVSTCRWNLPGYRSCSKTTEADDDNQLSVHWAEVENKSQRTTLNSFSIDDSVMLMSWDYEVNNLLWLLIIINKLYLTNKHSWGRDVYCGLIDYWQKTNRLPVCLTAVSRLYCNHIFDFHKRNVSTRLF